MRGPGSTRVSRVGWGVSPEPSEPLSAGRRAQHARRVRSPDQHKPSRSKLRRMNPREIQKTSLSFGIRSFGVCDFQRLRRWPHRQSDDFLVEIVGPKTGINREGRTIDTATTFAQEKHGGIGYFLRAQVAFPECEFLRVQIALKVAGNAGGCARLERTCTDDIEPNLTGGTKRFSQKARS